MATVELNADQVRMVAEAARKLPDHLLAECALPHVLGYMLCAPAEKPAAPAPVSAPPPVLARPVTLTERILEAIQAGQNKRRQIVEYVRRFQPTNEGSVDAILAMLKRNGEVTTTGRPGQQVYQVRGAGVAR